MIPNYKRPQINDYIFDILERPMTDEDLEMINYLQEYQQEMSKVAIQQKEFIKYLEDEIQSCEAVSDLLYNSNKEMKVYKEILTKYKKIMRISDEK